MMNVSSLGDLGVQLTDDPTFSTHIDNICKKVRQKCGWLHRTVYTRNPPFMKPMFNTLVQSHIDYCSQLWMPLEGFQDSGISTTGIDST